MRLVYRRFSVVTGFAVLIALLLINTAITHRQIAIQDSNQAWVVHTQQVLLELSTVESLLKDAETGQRGYLYTGEQRYLGPYNAAVAELPAHLDKLAQLTADNEMQQSRITVLRALTRQKLEELQQTVTLAQAGKQSEARAAVLSDVGRLLMDKIRTITGDMITDEKNLSDKRLDDVHHSTTTLVNTLYLTRALAVLGLVLLAFYILREMAAREKHAIEIRQREEWFRVTLASIGDAVIATDENGVVTFINPIAEELTGVKLIEARGLAIAKVFPIANEQTGKPVENPVAKVLETGRIMGLANHTVLQRRDGKIIPIEDSAAPIFDDQRKLRGVVMVFRDVTAEKQAQSVMRKAEKLAAAGRLAATVAHEINNPLEAVSNLIYIVSHTANLPEEVRGYLKLAEQELERVSYITRQTLGFYRESTVPAVVEMRPMVESVIRLYDNKLRSKSISIDLDVAERLELRGLQGELKQLVANLISNAADAVSAGGRIRISIYRRDEGVEIKVADDGPGIAHEHRAHIFEPFFTTKQDVGTGLGLWVSKGIAERHGGSIEVANGGEHGLRGAVFTVFLRAVGENAVSTGAA